MAQKPIDAGAIPVPTLDAATLQFEALELRTDAGTIRTRGADIKSTWAGLASVYKAPEDATLLAVMDPVAINTDAFATDTEQVATILQTFASEAGPLVATLRSTQADARSFATKVDGNGKWDHDSDLVKQNNAMVHTVNTTIVAFQAAERKAANAIETLIGGHTFHAVDPNSKTQDKYAYGYSSIPDNAKTPWGADVTKKDGCLKSSLTHVGHFFEGVGEGLWGMVKGIGTLAWDAVGGGGWDKFTQAWSGINFLVNLTNPVGWVMNVVEYGPKGTLDRVEAMGKGLVDWDEWKTDPAKAAGNTVANIGTLLIPIGGEVGAAADGAKGASLAADAGRAADVAGDAGKAGKLSSAVSKAGELTKTGLQTFGKLTDPFHYAAQLPKVLDVAKGLGIKIPDLGSLVGHDGSAVAHLGGDAGHLGGDAGHLGGDAGNVGGDAGHVGGDAGHVGGGAGHDGSGQPVGAGGHDAGSDHGAPPTGHPSDPDTPAKVTLADGTPHTPWASDAQLHAMTSSESALTAVLTHEHISPTEFKEMINAPASQLTHSDVQELIKIRHEVPTPEPGDALQKALNAQTGDDLLGHQTSYAGNTVRGFVSHAGDTAGLHGVTAQREGFALTYDKGTKFLEPGREPAFDPNAAYSYSLRFRTDAAPSIPFGPDFGGHVPDAPPFTGNGFTASHERIMPEYKFDKSVRMDEGAEMWRVNADGSEELAGVLNGKGEWVPVG